MSGPADSLDPAVNADAVVVGLGLNSHATLEDVLGAVDDALASIERSRIDVLTVTTAEHRRDHPALRGLPMPLMFFASDRFADREVAEPAAHLGAPAGRLLVPKQCTSRVCVAIVAATGP